MLNAYKKQNGFTIVELLIVIVIIGVLAAITIVAYNGIQDRASDTVVQSDIRNFAGKVAEFQAINGRYPNGGLAGAPEGIPNFKLARPSYASNVHNFVYCRGTVDNVDTFAVAAMSKSRKVFAYYSQGGLREFTGSWSSGVIASVCPALGIPTYSYTYGYNLDGTWFSWTQ